MEISTPPATGAGFPAPSCEGAAGSRALSTMEAAYYERGDVGGTLARALCVFASLVALALALFLLPKSTSNFPFVHEFKNALSTPPGSKSVASAAGGQTGGVCTALPVLKDLSAPEIALQNIPHGYATNGSDVSTYQHVSTGTLHRLLRSTPTSHFKMASRLTRATAPRCLPVRLSRSSRSRRRTRTRLTSCARSRRASPELPSSYSRAPWCGAELPRTLSQPSVMSRRSEQEDATKAARSPCPRIVLTLLRKVVY